jgi:hypothetical protein
MRSWRRPGTRIGTHPEPALNRVRFASIGCVVGVAQRCLELTVLVAMRQLGLEGIVAKRLSSRLPARRPLRPRRRSVRQRASSLQRASMTTPVTTSSTPAILAGVTDSPRKASDASTVTTG